MIDHAVRGRAHDVLLVALIALRPLIWSGEAGAWDNLAWLLLVVVALAWLVVDAWRGRVPAWRCAWGGVLAGVLLLVLLPAALRSSVPASGLGLWGMAVVHLGFAAYLMQVVASRERLAFAALAGALAVQGVVALGQWAWVLPRLAQALASGDPGVLALENAQGDLAERVANGGLFGTFTLANTLAAYLLLAAVPLAGAAGAARGGPRLVAVGVVAIAVLVACGTASKGAAVALALAALAVWSLRATGGARWLGAGSLVLLVVAMISVPPLRDAGAASAAVRLGYWRGAAVLIREAPLAGHGLHGFAAHAPRAMPVTAEPTRHVHNDVLEAAVDGGLPAGLAALAWLAWCARRRPVTVTPPPDAQVPTQADSARWWRAAWPLLAILPFFCALGTLASNLAWWPAGAGDATWWLWPLALALLLVAVAAACARLPPPPAWAWQLALTAFALHCALDFDLQSPAIWGSVSVAAVLAGGRCIAFGTCRISCSVVTALVLALALGLGVGMQRAGQLASLAGLLGGLQQQPTAGTPAQRQELAALAFAAASRWPADPALMLAALQAFPPRGDRLALSSAAAARLPWSAQAHELHAQDLAARGAWPEAVAAMEAAVACTPAQLPRRERLARLLAAAGAAVPTLGVDLHQRAQDEWSRLAALAPLVHPRNRLRAGGASGLAVQPAPQ